MFNTKAKKEQLVLVILPALVSGFLGLLGGSWYSGMIYDNRIQNYQKQISEYKIAIENNEGISVGTNNGEISMSRTATKTEENIHELDNLAQGNLRTFFSRWARGDIESARSQFHDEISDSNIFSFDNMTRFKNEVLNGEFYLDELEEVGDCTDSIYASKCLYKFYLRYVDKRSQKKIVEGWTALMLNNKNKDSDYFKINSLKCEDKNCMDNSMLNW